MALVRVKHVHDFLDLSLYSVVDELCSRRRGDPRKMMTRKVVNKPTSLD